MVPNNQPVKILLAPELEVQPDLTLVTIYAK